MTLAASWTDVGLVLAGSVCLIGGALTGAYINRRRNR